MTTMKAIQAPSYGPSSILTLDDIPKPTIIPKNKILVAVEAVALAPGDVRVLSGKCKELNGPPSFPYIPGGDCCGKVVDMGDIDSAKVGYTVGDRIAARFVEGPRGMLCEYALVSTKMTSKVPDSASSNDAAALASSATIALQLSRRISKNEKVLILGAGGGLGSHLCQFLRLKGVTTIAGVSRDPERLLKEPISCTHALDYTKNDPFAVSSWDQYDDLLPFDTVVDLASGGWPKLLQKMHSKEDMVVKPANQGGRFLATSIDTAWFELHSIWKALVEFDLKNRWRSFYSKYWYRTKLPAFAFTMNLSQDTSIMEETLRLASENKIKACLDERGPFSFDALSVQQAFDIQESCHVHGKLIVSVSADKILR